MKISISRSLIAAVLAATVAFSQDLKPASATFDVARLETETFRELKNESSVTTQTQPQQQSVAKPDKKGGHKKLWITLAAVGGGAAIAAFAVNKKLANEGGSIVIWR